MSRRGHRGFTGPAMRRSKIVVPPEGRLVPDPPLGKCGCPDRNDAQHCLLLQDFPGGFYGDMEASREDKCDCVCHRDDEEYDDGE